MSDDSERVKRVAAGVRKKLMGMALKPSDMSSSDRKDADPQEIGKELEASSTGEDVSSRTGLDELQGRDGMAADKDPKGPDIKLESMSIQPISKSKHFRSIMDAYKKVK